MHAPSTDSMTSRERVLATVRGLPVDRVPVMTWLNPHAGCRLIAEFRPTRDQQRNNACREAWENFSREQGELPADVRNFLPLLHSQYLNCEYALELGSDLATLGIPIADLGEKVSGDGEPFRVRDMFGSVRGMVGPFLEVVEPAVTSIADLVDLPLPDISDPRPYDTIRRFRAESPGACLYGESFGAQDLPSTQIWEMSQFMMALYDHPDEVKRFQARFNDHMISMSRRMVEAGADVIFIYDDYGTSGSPLTSVEMWMEFTYPLLAKHIEAVHDAGALERFPAGVCELRRSADLQHRRGHPAGRDDDGRRAARRHSRRLSDWRAERAPHPRLHPHAPAQHAGREHRGDSDHAGRNPGRAPRRQRRLTGGDADDTLVVVEGP